MLGVPINKLVEVYYSNFYELADKTDVTTNRTISVDKHSRIFQSYPKDSQGSKTIDFIPLQGSSELVSEAEIQRILRYEFEGLILPAINISKIDFKIINNSAISIDVTFSNCGKIPLFGHGSLDAYDSIYIDIYQEDLLIRECLLEFPFRVLKQEEELNLHTLVEQIDLKVGVIELDIGISKSSYGKIPALTDKQRRRHRITNEIRSTQINFSCLKSKTIALTFDGGGNPPPSEGVLKILSETGTQASFFLTSSFIKRHPDYTKQILDLGHEIGNHTYSHPKLCEYLDPNTISGVDHAYLKLELERMADDIYSLCKYKVAPIWRAPFGAYNSWTSAWAYEIGYKHIFWNFDSNDWRIPDTKQKLWTADVVLKKLRIFTQEPPDSSIILFHTGVDYLNSTLYSGLTEIIRNLKEKGYSFVKVSEAL